MMHGQTQIKFYDFCWQFMQVLLLLIRLNIEL